MNQSKELKTNNRFDSLKGSASSTNAFAGSPRYREGATPEQAGGAYSSQTRGAYSSQTRGVYSSQTRGAYSTPQSRNRSGSSNLFVAAKKEPKKEFSAKAEMFPMLQQAEVKKETTATPALDFTSALKRKKKTKKKWEGTRMEAKPGYVVLYYDECGRMQRVYGEGSSETNDPPTPNRAAILNRMVARWQERRDYLNKTHGQLSPYYGQKSLLEEPDEDDYDNWGDNGADVDGEPEDDYGGDY
jgi:hypothetical protein